MLKLRIETEEGRYLSQDLLRELELEFFPTQTRTPSEKWIKIAEELALANAAVLPSYSWLMKNGYSKLCWCIAAHPMLFAHIKQDVVFKTVDEWVLIAEELAEKNGGTLQNPAWLQKNKYSGLCLCMTKHPDEFAHIKQVKKYRLLKENIALAEELCRKNDGILPNSKWLTDNGYGGLDSAIRTKPKEFVHLKRSRKRKLLKEHIDMANILIKKNNGILPSHSWLRKNGYTTLSTMISRKHKEFNGFKKQRLHRTTGELIRDIEYLLNINNNKIPTFKWLMANGYSHIVSAFKVHPELFEKREREYEYKGCKRRNLDEWEKMARLLEKKYGALPSYRWLRSNGYSGLKRCIKNNPEIFKGIKQDYGHVKNKKVRTISE